MGVPTNTKLLLNTAVWPSALVMAMLTGPTLEEAGVTAISFVVPSKATDDAGTEPKEIAARLWNPEPVMVTVVPPETGPPEGVMPPRVGGATVTLTSSRPR